MIVWINGPFGAGKTTLSAALDGRDDVTVVDTEYVGYLLRPLLDGPRPVANFQDWPAWRALSGAFVRELHDELGGMIVVPQSVFDESYWDELLTGIGESVTAVTLDVARPELERRIHGDVVETGAVQWRLDQAALYEAALPWLRRRTHVLDTTSLAPADVVERVLELVI